MSASVYKTLRRPSYIRPPLIRPPFIRPPFIRPPFIRPPFIRPPFIRLLCTPIFDRVYQKLIMKLIYTCSLIYRSA